MRLTLVLIILIFATAAPAAAAIQPSSTSHAAQGTTIDVYGPRGPHRVYLFHGLGGSRQAMRVRPYDRLITQLVARGWQIIVPSLPYDTGATQALHLRAAFSDGTAGQSYRLMWQRRFHALVKTINRRYGRAAQTIVMGVSWGGFHALQAACNEPSVSSYIVHEPVLQPTNLTEFHGMNLTNLPLGAGCLRKLAAKHGFIGYGSADTRVGVAPTAAIIRSVHATACEYAGLDHSTTLLSVDNMLRASRGMPPAGCSTQPQAAPADSDQIDIDLTRLEQIAQQWWAGYGLTTDMPYAAGGYQTMPGCGATVRILREHLSEGEIGEVAYPHGCDIHIDEDLVRAGLTNGPRTHKLAQALAQAGLRPGGRYAARELLCAVMFHETGHVLGLPHQPTGIMQDKAPAPPQACMGWATT